ncbi:unnamed protein product [Euphydryas editha]|uniref:FLYWCH-type domain-containing protein n=1 Tax=Euphydryas editha TaxID=104508 RepID=A0AAU9TJP5_EUPED|nr:unnamed protein product [Euphydryas editha]
MRQCKIRSFISGAGIEFVTSRRGRRMIKLNGYTYSATPKMGLKIRWKCSTHQHHGCRAALVTVNEEIVLTNENHIHPPIFKSTQNDDMK